MDQNYMWLNEAAQQFLEKDYLLPGQSVDDRVTEICLGAEKILNRPDFAERFKKNIKKGWYSLSTPVWTNFGNDRGMPISCVTGETWINTKDGIKNAEDIKIGDEVFTHECRYQKVTNVIVTANKGEIYELRVRNQSPLYITGNHPVLTRYGWIRVDKLKLSDLVATTHPMIDYLVSSRVESVKITNRVETVYDFTVEEDHSFSASGIILHNCFGSHIDDTTESILFTNAEVGIMSKYGGGTSAYFGGVRPRGTDIHKNGKSSGAVHFLQLFNTTVDVISQGSARRGSFAAYLPIDHPDILEFLTVKHEGSPIQNIFTGVCVPDNWMQDMVGGDKEKRKIWAKVLESRSNVGLPYILFIGNANRGKPDVYQDKNLEIRHSNLCCVTGDQITITDRGNFTVEDLYKQGVSLKLFDGRNFVEASEMKLISSSADAYKIILENSLSHTVTFQHKVKTDKGMVQTCDLKKGDRVAHILGGDGYSKIVSINYVGKHPVYCPHVYSETHEWICNNIVTHNSEIMLPTASDESFVCDLSSMNILYYDDWKGTDAVELMIYFLDAVMTEFIHKAKNVKFMERAVKFAERHRALGLGWLGWHNYLQSHMIPFESMEAKYKNVEIAKTISEQAMRASQKMAQEYGEPELLKGYGRRHTTLQAIAPTTSSSFIIGQASKSIEPELANYYIDDLAKGKFTMQNPYLKKLLAEKGQDNDPMWQSILRNAGSVQQTSCLTPHEKSVFKTFQEISPKEIIIQAAQRQKYIDQGQSLNLWIHPNTPIREVNAFIIEAWKLGIKSLYYQYSINAAQSFYNNLLNCSNCEA